MSNPASVADVEARWRPLSAQEAQNAAAYLMDAWALLKSKISGLDAAAAADPDLAENVIRVEAQMVLRVLKNVDGVTTTTISVDDASRTVRRDGVVASGWLYVSDDELEELSPGATGAGAFTIRPTAVPYCTPLTPVDPVWGQPW